MITPDFLITPYQLIVDKSIEPNDRDVYALVYWFEHLKDGRCTAANTTIAQILNIAPRSVQNSLTKLENLGYIDRVYKNESKRHRKEIKTKVSFKAVRSGGDTGKQSEPVVILERSGGDTQSAVVVTRESNRNKNRNKKGELPDGIHESSWLEWIEYRKEIKKKMTPRTQAMQIKLLSKYSKSDQEQIINTSIQNGWTGLFDLKAQNAVTKPEPSKYAHL